MRRWLIGFADQVYAAETAREAAQAYGASRELEAGDELVVAEVGGDAEFYRLGLVDIDELTAGAHDGEYPYPTRRVSLGLSGGHMNVSLPGKPEEPLDDETLEALRAIGEAAIKKMLEPYADA